MAETIVYVGTYTYGKSKGIYTYRMDKESGQLRFLHETIGVENPSYLAVDPQQRHLYAVNELKTFEGKPSGSVSAFSIDPETNKLTFLNVKPSLGVDPCHIIVDKANKHVLTANYSSGNVSIYAIREDGQLGELTDLVQHHGSGANPERQEGPHAHSIILDSADQYAFVQDLGLDKILIYKFDQVRGRLTPNDEPWVTVKPGSGPRHFAFHPSGKFAYLINELSSTITAFAYDKAQGKLKEIQTISALAKEFLGTSTCADVNIDPSGKFVYGSNRGQDSIVGYEIDQDTGRLSYIGHWNADGKIRTPRGFAIDPDGEFLFAASQDGDNIITFRIDQETGKLKETKYAVRVPTPVCVKMIRKL